MREAILFAGSLPKMPHDLSWARLKPRAKSCIPVPHIGSSSAAVSSWELEVTEPGLK